MTDNIIVTGVAAAAAPPISARSAQFEAARAASKQRAAINLVAADEADARRDGGAGATRRVGQRSFTLNGERWVDSRRGDSANVVKVRAFSEAWFKLIDALPELKEVFALGERVLVTGRDVTIESGPDGKEVLSEPELRIIKSRW